MIRRCAYIIQEDLNLEVSMDFGVKDGLAAGNLGTPKAVHSVFIEVKEKIGRSNSVLIMVSLTLSLCTLTATAVNPMLLMHPVR